jgi:hypothetical protein
MAKLNADGANTIAEILVGKALLLALVVVIGALVAADLRDKVGGLWNKGADAIARVVEESQR